MSTRGRVACGRSSVHNAAHSLHLHKASCLLPHYTHQQWQQLPAHLVAGVNPLAATSNGGKPQKMKQKTKLKLKANRVHFTLHYTARARALESVILQHVAAVVAVAFAFAVAVRCERRERGASKAKRGRVITETCRQRRTTTWPTSSQAMKATARE